MINKLLTTVSLCVLALFSAVTLSQEVEDQEFGLPSLDDENEFVSEGSDVLEPLREGELFGIEVPELLVEPELEEDEVVERATNYRLSRISAYSSNRLPTRAMRVPLVAQPRCGERIINRSVSAYPLSRRLDGDDKMNGAVSIWIDGEIARTNGRVFVRGKIDMKQGNVGGTWYRHTFDQTIFNVTREAPGCRIKSVGFAEDQRYIETGSTSGRGYAVPIRASDGGRIYGRSRKGDDQFRTYSANSSGSQRLFTSANCRTDVKGKAAGKIGCNQIRVRPLKIQLVPMENGKACQRIQIQLPGKMNGQANATIGIRDLFPLRRIRGDANVKGKVNVTAIAKVAWDTNRVRLYHRLIMQEKGGDRTRFDSASTTNLIDAALDAPGCKITGVTGYVDNPLVGRLNFVVDTQRWRATDKTAAGGLLDSMKCRTNAGSNDDQRLGCYGIEYETKFLNITFE